LPDRLLDTNALAAAMRADAALERYLLRVGGEGSLFTSVVVEGEVRFGIGRLPDGRRKKLLTRALDEILAHLGDVLPIHREAASRYAQLKGDLWKRGKPMGENDLWLAAAAVAQDLVLVTNDGSFRNVKGLIVENWLEA